MSDLQFSRAEIEVLAGKLAEVGLEDREKQLLLAIFAAARSQLRTSQEGAADITVDDLRRQLLTAFMPDDGIEFFLAWPNIHNIPGGDTEQS